MQDEVKGARLTIQLKKIKYPGKKLKLQFSDIEHQAAQKNGP